MTDTEAALHLVTTPPIARARSAAATEILRSPALAAFIRERLEQIEKHGFTPDHDQQHGAGELALGAVAYVRAGLADYLGDIADPAISEAFSLWPWPDLFRPTDYRGNLVKAIAMLWAEIDRIDIAEAQAEIAGMVDAGAELQTIISDALDGRACRVCGCTEVRACVTDGLACHWVDLDLCSACDGKPEPAARA